MWVLGRTALSILVSGLLIGSLCAGMLLTRLWPWWGSVPWGVLWPLARALLFHAFEWTSLLSVPLAVGWAGASALAPGSWRSRWFLLGPLLLGIAAVQASVLTLGYRESEAPGQLVQRLIAEGRQGCFEAHTGDIVIPVVGLTWGCAHIPPRVSGTLEPWGAFSARSLAPSDDLRSFEMEDLALTLLAKEFPKTKLRVRQASVSGLRAWGRPTTNQFGGRVPFIVVSTWVLCWIALRLSLRFARARRALGAVLSSAPALILVLTSLQLDQLNSAGWVYWALPPGLLVAVEGLLASVRRFARPG